MALMVALISFMQTYKIYIYKVLKQVHPVSATLNQSKSLCACGTLPAYRTLLVCRTA